MPRSRAAQAAYAMQLYDRGIITTPSSLAKVADLPDQDDLMDGIDPDTARAQRENYWLAVGTPRTVDVYDDHNNHMKLHRDFVRSERYEYLPPEIQELVQQHMQAHAIYAAEQAAQQVQAAGFSPIAAAMPSVATSVIPSETLADSTAIQALAPRPGGPPAADEQPEEPASKEEPE